MSSRSNKSNRTEIKVPPVKIKKPPMKKPKDGGGPKKIGEGMGSPGGSQTPGEKGTYPMPDKKDEK